jgi:lipoprotein-releasing system permease protein
MAAVALGACALVIVLSVFNGLEDFVRALYSSFDPEIKIEASVGKSFEISEGFIESIENTPGVGVVTQVVEDNAYVRFRDSEMVVNLKGVEDNFLSQNRLDNALVAGEMKLREGDVDYAIIGQGVQYKLSIPPNNSLFLMELYYPKRGRITSMDPTRLVNNKLIMPAGVFAIEKQYDMNYIFAPLDFVVDLFEYDQRRTSLEIKTESGYQVSTVKNNLQKLLGNEFRVLDSDEQHSTLLKVLKMEKLFVFITFSFIIAVASFNIFFSLTMLAIDKKKDISILYSLGATNRFIRSIFIKEGSIIALLGAVMGLGLGLIVVLAQQTFGFVSMGMVTSVLDAYPVKIVFTDFVYIAGIIIVITFLASHRPATIAARYNDWKNLK